MIRKDENDRIYIDKPKIFKKLDEDDDGNNIFIKACIGGLILLLALMILGIIIGGIVALAGGIGWWIVPVIISLPFIGYFCYWIGHKLGL